VLVCSNAATGGIFWWLGHRAEIVKIQSAVDRLPAAVQHGVKAAPVWFAQMQADDTETALASCRRFEENGLGVCRLGLWLEAPPSKPTGDAK
jgi:hypothetical protein